MARMPPPKRRQVARGLARKADPGGRLSNLDIDIQIKRLDDAAKKRKKLKKVWR